MKTSHVLFTDGENGQYGEKRDDTARSFRMIRGKGRMFCPEVIQWLMKEEEIVCRAAL